MRPTVPHFLRISRLDQIPGFTVMDDIAYPIDVIRNDRNSRAHRFLERYRQAFPQGRGGYYVQNGQNSMNIISKSEQKTFLL